MKLICPRCKTKMYRSVSHLDEDQLVDLAMPLILQRITNGILADEHKIGELRWMIEQLKKILDREPQEASAP